MKMYDLVIEGKMLHGGKWVDGAVCVSEGVISDLRMITPSRSSVGSIESHPRCCILPGIVDSHVHFRDPGSTNKEDFKTGTMSAAFGGVTTILDMPNTIPPVIDGRTLSIKEEVVSRKAYIDYGLNLAVTDASTPDSVSELLTGQGETPPPAGLKVFLGETTGSIVLKHPEVLSTLKEVLSSNHAVVSIHPEDGSFFRAAVESARDEEVLSTHYEMRPPQAERSAIILIARHLEGAQDRAHLLHVSTEIGIKEARGTEATVEVTPHHLLLDLRWAERGLECPAMGKVNPPLRRPSDRMALWKGIREGDVYTIGSDHAPHLLEEKERGLESLSGIPGTETMLPLMLMKVVERKIDQEILIRLLCSNPAERWRLERKGGLEVGKDADVIVVDMKAVRKIRGEDLHSKCGWTPYEGMSGIFPKRVFSRGELIVEDESLCSKPGRGMNVKRDH